MPHAPRRRAADRRTLVAILGGVALACTDAAVGSPTAPAGADAAAPAEVPEEVLLPRGSAWQYFDGGAVTGTAWRVAAACPPLPCFAEATAPLGYGEPYLATAIGFGPDPADRHVTTYARSAFVAPARARELHLRVMYDDGFVLYLDGEEVARVGLPEGPIRPSTLALDHEAEARYATIDLSAWIPRLAPGAAHRLAVEIHQADPASADLVFDAELVAR
jgi:hypothetical protein